MRLVHTCDRYYEDLCRLLGGHRTVETITREFSGSGMHLNYTNILQVYISRIYSMLTLHVKSGGFNIHGTRSTASIAKNFRYTVWGYGLYTKKVSAVIIPQQASTEILKYVWLIATDLLSFLTGSHEDWRWCQEQGQTQRRACSPRAIVGCKHTKQQCYQYSGNG